jgi:hypothetical protein
VAVYIERPLLISLEATGAFMPIVSDKIVLAAVCRTPVHTLLKVKVGLDYNRTHRNKKFIISMLKSTGKVQIISNRIPRRMPQK